MKYDVVIIGGGPSGILAAIAARKNGANTLLIEKNNKLGRKMLISGGGRCNLSNISSIEKIIENIPGNGRILYGAFHQFSNMDLIHFFEDELNIKTKVEDKGRVFPATDRSKTLVDALTKYLKHLGVQIKLESSVEELLIEDNNITGVRLLNDQIIKTKSIILATGGKSFPKTGSTGDGYKFAKKAGHTVKELYPSSVPLNSEDMIIKEKLLQGISLKNVELTLYDPNGKRVITEEGDMIFTHFGISGPVVLRLSRSVALSQKKFGNISLKVTIDSFPQYSSQELVSIFNDLIEKNPKKQVLNGLNGFLPEKYLKGLAIINEDIFFKKMNQLGKKDLQNLSFIMKNFSLNITGHRSLDEATVTGGGVNIKEINPKTFASKIIEGLYIAGELLDIDGHTGGYNIQAAFTTGFVAGNSAGKFSKER